VKKEAFIAWLSELNNTEKEVLDGIIRGKTIKTIALELGVDLKTVELHRANAMSKLNVRNLPELLRLSFIASRDAFPGSVQT
jgi:two-component system response regulator FixJ